MPIQIDCDKLRAAVRKLGNDYVFNMLNDAIELLPPARLHKLAKKYFDLKELQSDANQPMVSSLRRAARRFQKASLAGKYYESFNVNSKNHMEKSAGTRAWIAEYHRLLNRCVNSAKGCEQAEVREAMDILFGLLDHIDECLDDVIFFADEGGSWQVGVDWANVLPVWFKALSATAEPDEYAKQIKDVLSGHYSYGSGKMLALALRIATPEQRKALEA